MSRPLLGATLGTASPTFAGPPLSSRWIGETLFWCIVALVGACGVAFEQPAAGLIAAAVLVTGRCVVEPKLSAHVLVLSLTIYFGVGVGGGVTLPRLVAVSAGLVSLPALLSALGRRPYDPIVRWVVALLGLAVVTIPLSPETSWTVLQTASLFQVWGMVLILCLHLRTREDVRTALAVLCAGSVALAIYLFSHPDFLAVVEGQASRLVVAGSYSGERVEINEVARTLGFGLIAAVSLLQTVRSPLGRAGLVAGVALLGIGILATQSRVCYVVVPGALLVGAALSSPGGRVRRLASIGAVVLLLGGLLVLASSLGLFGEGIRQRIDSIADPTDTSRVRLAFWAHYLQQSADSLFLGNGLGGTRWSMPWLNEHAMPQVSHNDLIEVLADLGVAGATAFVVLHVVMIRRILRLQRPAERFFAVASWVLLVGCGLTQVDFYRKYYLLVFGLVLALVRADEAARAR